MLAAASACSKEKPTLFVYCAAGMKDPIQKLADDFEAARGVKIEMAEGGSNTLLGQITLSRRGDIYVAGDADYINMAAERGLVETHKTLCYFVPVIMVAKGNPKNIATLGDLTQPGIRIGQGDERATAIGRLMPKILELNGVDYAAWKKNVVTAAPTVNELGLKVELRALDAAVVWESIAIRYPTSADIIPIPREKNICPEVAAAVLKFTKNGQDATAFLEFLTSPRGRQVLAEAGYTVDKP